MTMPFILITTHEVDSRRFDEFRDLTAEYTAFVETNEPDLIAHHAYLDQERHQVSLVQIHPDADSAERHLQLVRPWVGRSAELSKPVRVEVYGEPGPVVTQALRANAEAGAAVSVAATAQLGFSRETVAS